VSQTPQGIDLPEPEPKPGIPWIGIGIAAAVFALAAVWLMHSKSSGSRAEIAALGQELKDMKALMDDERDTVFELTDRLDALKKSIARGLIDDREKAVTEYNKLAAEQRAHREKAKDLADLYNSKLARLQALQ